MIVFWVLTPFSITSLLRFFEGRCFPCLQGEWVWFICMPKWLRGGNVSLLSKGCRDFGWSEPRKMLSTRCTPLSLLNIRITADTVDVVPRLDNSNFHMR